jgi:hypothetical protein
MKTATERKTEADARAAAIKNPPKRTLELTPASAMEMEATLWMWEERLPLGAISLLVGREGGGKSTVGIDIAARLSHGTLAGDLYGQSKGSIIVATEDSWSKTINPRLSAVGADMTKVHKMGVKSAEGYGGGEFNLPEDNDELERLISENNIGFVLLDPMMSRLDSKLDTHKDQEVRQGLEPLAAVCDRTDVNLLGLVHLNKARGTDALSRIMASRAFPAMPDDPNTKVLGVPKSNLGSTDERELTRTFTIDSKEVGFDERRNKAITGSFIEWGEDIPVIMDELLKESEKSAGARKGTGAVKDATTWLIGFLCDQPKRTASSAFCKEAGVAAGHSESSLKRALPDAAIIVERAKVKGAGTTWRLTLPL